MTPTLRPYQQESIASIRAEYRAGCRRVLFVLPTGGGKTVVFSHIAQQAAGRGNRVLILVHRVELLDQACRSLAAMGVAHAAIAAGRPMDLTQLVQVASVQTVARRLAHLPADLFQLVIVDEAHHATAGTWQQVLEHLHSARVLGVTATPCRTDGRGLGEQFEAMILGPSPAWLTDHGYLAPARVFCPPGFDATGLHRRMGDFDPREAAARVQVGDAVSHYRTHLAQQTAIAFCCTVAHAEAVAAAFQSEGIAAASIDGRMDASTRRHLLEQLGAGELKVLTSCSLIGEGVDVPSVAGCLLLRPTQSLSLHLQMIGRCLRPQSGKVAVILDHVGNIPRLGHHLDPQDWTLDGVHRRAKDAAASVKVCPSCFAAAPGQAATCENCGHLFTAETKPRGLERIDGTLEEIHAGQPVAARKREQGRAQTLEELIAVGQRRGMRNAHGWARHVLAARQSRRAA